MRIDCRYKGFRIVKTLLTCLLLFACATAASAFFTDAQESKPLHHTASGFQNKPHGPDRPATTSLGVGFYYRRFKGSFFPPTVPEGHILPQEAALRALDGLLKHDTITWIGQATFLIRINGKNILTDPFFTNNAFPLAGVGPRRYTPPGISIENLPTIDIIVISHDHHDHLDPKTIKALPNKEMMTVFAPLGLRNFFAENGYQTIHELDWHQSGVLDGITFAAMPAVHNSGRGLNNQNKTLWCSWAIRNATVGLYFAGDTAYSSTAFKEIGTKHGPFDAALVPIGAYEPRDFMQAYHVNPEEAVQIGIDLDAKNLIAMHWGTIDLSDEPHWEPPQRFRAHAKANGYPADRAWVLKIGETRALSR